MKKSREDLINDPELERAVMLLSWLDGFLYNKMELSKLEVKKIKFMISKTVNPTIWINYEEKD